MPHSIVVDWVAVRLSAVGYFHIHVHDVNLSIPE
jgi:hypothetical protein